MAERSSWWQRAAEPVRGLVARYWRPLLRWRPEWRPNEGPFHLLLAAGIGVIGGLTNLLFYLATESFKLLALHRPGDLVTVAAMLSPFARLAVPTLGALAAGLVLHWGLHLTRRQRASNLVEAVVAGDGRLSFRSALLKATSSLLSISTGASIGREGSIVHLAAALASKLGQGARWHPYRLRLLTACGAAAGMAAAYNAPIGGAVFAAHIVLGNFSMNLFAPLVVASVVAAMVSRSFFGIEQWYHVPDFEFTRLAQLPWFLVLGGAAGVVGAGVLKLLRVTERAFQGSGWPLYLRVTLAGFVVGGVALLYPEVWGNGYSVVTRVLAGGYGMSLLAALLLAKLLCTVTAVGSGTVGGVFTPTLFLGAAVGSLFGHALRAIGLEVEPPMAAFALVGMASLLAATTHAPLLAMIMVFEISLNYSLMPPLMLACAVATLVARQFHRASVYTQVLEDKGVRGPDDSEFEGAATQQTVGDLMKDPVAPLRETARFRAIADRFLTSANNFVPVVDKDQRLLGVVALQDLKEYLNAGEELSAVIAYDLMRPPAVCLTPNQRLLEALPALLASEQRNVPVVNNLREYRLVGAVSRNEALGILSEAIAARSGVQP